MSLSPLVRIVDLPEETIDHILETIHARRSKYVGGVIRPIGYRRPRNLVREPQGVVDTIMSIRLTCRLFARIARPWAFRRLSCKFAVHRSQSAFGPYASPSRNIGLSDETLAFYQSIIGHVRCLEISFHLLDREYEDLEAEQWVDDAILPLGDGMDDLDLTEYNASRAFEQFLPILHSMDNLEVLILHARDVGVFDPFHEPWKSSTKLANIHSLFLDLEKAVSLDRLQQFLGDRALSRLHYSSSNIYDFRDISTPLFETLISTEVLSICDVPPKAVLPWFTLLELTLDYERDLVGSAEAAWRSLQEWQSTHPDVCLPLRELSIRTEHVGWWGDIFKDISLFLNLLSLLTSPGAHDLAKPGVGAGLRRLTFDGNHRQIVPDSTNGTVPRAFATLGILFPVLEDLGFYIEEDEASQPGKGPAFLMLERCKFRRLKIFRCEHDFLTEWLGWELKNEDRSKSAAHSVQALLSRFPRTIAPLFPRLDILRSRPNVYYSWWDQIGYAGMEEGHEATMIFVRPASPRGSDGDQAPPVDAQDDSGPPDDGTAWTMSLSTTPWPNVDSDGVLTTYWREAL